MRKVYIILLTFGISLILALAAGAQVPWTIAYDDGNAYYYSGRPDPGDTCGVWFEPPTECRLLSAQFQFYSEGDIEFFIWGLAPGFDPDNYYDTDEVAGTPAPSPLGAVLAGPIPYTIGPDQVQVWDTLVFADYGYPPGTLNVGTDSFFVGYVLLGTGTNIYDPSISGDPGDARPYHSLCYLTTPGGAHPTEPGWWAYGIDWLVRTTVDMYGNPPPVIAGLEDFPDTYTSGPYAVSATITDQVVGGGVGQVASAMLKYKIGSGTEVSVNMLNAGGDLYTANLPAVLVDSILNYRVEAADNGTPPRSTIFPNLDGFSFTYRQPSGASILLVNDDEEGAEEFYTIAFADTAYGVDYDYWLIDPGSPNNYGMPGADVIDHTLYSTILWFNGSGNTGNLPDNDAILADEPIVQFMDDGGNLFLTSSDYLGGAFTPDDWDEFTAISGTFMYDYLHVADGWSDAHLVGAASVDTAYIGVAGDPVGGPFSAYYFQNFPDPNYNDYANPTSDAFTCFRTKIDDESAGIRYSGTYKMVFLPWVLEACEDASLAQEIIVSVLQYFGEPVGVKPLPPSGAPLTFALEQNYPNPFNPITNIRFQLPTADLVKLALYDVSGRQMATLVNGWRAAGTHEVTFDAANLASGVYLYTLTAGQHQATGKLVLMK